MSVGAGMSLTLVPATRADRRARLEQGARDAGVVGRHAACDPHGGSADICAVQAQPDAGDHLGDVLIAQVSVSISGARLSAVVERVDGGGEQFGVDRGGGLGVQDLLCVAHVVSPQLAMGDGSEVPVPLARSSRAGTDRKSVV